MLSENALKVASSRYFRDEETSWEDVCRRVSKAVSSVEQEGEKERQEELFFDMLYNLKALPGGRTLRNSGFTNTLLNCHVLQLADSMKSTPERTGIGRFIDMALVLNSEGGGVGCNPPC